MNLQQMSFLCSESWMRVIENAAETRVDLSARLIDKRAKAIKKWRRRCKNLRRRINIITAESDRRLAQMRRGQERIAELECQAQAWNAQLNDLTSRLANMTENNGALRNRIAGLKEEQAGLKETIETLEMRLDHMATDGQGMINEFAI